MKLKKKGTRQVANDRAIRYKESISDENVRDELKVRNPNLKH
jgi:hypothetical protein